MMMMMMMTTPTKKKKKKMMMMVVVMMKKIMTRAAAMTTTMTMTSMTTMGMDSKNKVKSHNSNFQEQTTENVSQTSDYRNSVSMLSCRKSSQIQADYFMLDPKEPTSKPD